GLDVLVNNAGRGYYGEVTKIDPREFEGVFALNVLAPLCLAQLAMEPLRKSCGTIVMISSIAGVVAAPHMGAYAATKFALEALSMSLRAEIAKDNIHVLVVRPGPVDTPFREHSIARGEKRGVRPRGATVQTPDNVACQIVNAIDRRASVLETTLF